MASSHLINLCINPWKSIVSTQQCSTMWDKYVKKKWLLPRVSVALVSSDKLGQVEYTCEPSKAMLITSRLPLLIVNSQIFSSEQQQEMHKICSLAYERLQRLLRKCQGHLCCSKRVWNEDGECVTLRWEVITGSSKAAHYVSFTGHSLVGQYNFYPVRLCNTLTLSNKSSSVLSSNMH